MLSLVINTYNNEQEIADCILSASSLVDEVVICDMYSNDQTVPIAQTLGAKVVYHPKIPIADPARHTAISAASGDWVLVLDADERMVPKTAAKIREVIRQQQHDVIFLWSNNLYFGDYVANGGFFYEQARCFQKELYLSTYDESEVRAHRNFIRVGELANNPLHLSEDYFYYHLAYPTIEKYVTKTLGFYGAIESQYDYEHGVRFSKFRLVYQPVKDFFVRYVRKQGYRDGTRGLILCVLFALYGFIKWANLWFLEEQAKGATASAPLPKPSLTKV